MESRVGVLGRPGCLLAGFLVLGALHVIDWVTFASICPRALAERSEPLDWRAFEIAEERVGREFRFRGSGTYCGKRPGYSQTRLVERGKGDRCGVSLDGWFGADMGRTPDDLAIRRAPDGQLFVVTGHQLVTANQRIGTETFVVAFSRTSSPRLRLEQDIDVTRLAIGMVALVLRPKSNDHLST